VKNIKRITIIVLSILLLLSGSVLAAGIQITSIPDPFPSEDTTYFGRWTALSSTISFDTNGGSAVDDMSSVTDAVISDTSMPTTTKEGNSFLGWFDNSGLTGEAITTLPGAYPANGITYYAKWEEDVVKLPAMGTLLEDCTWDEIEAIADAGLADEYFDVGDQKTVANSLAGAQTYRILGFNHDTIAGTANKASITFGLASSADEYFEPSIVASDTKYADVDRSAYSYLLTYYYGNSNIHNKLNGDFYNGYPQDLQDVIVPVAKYTARSYNTNGFDLSFEENVVTERDTVVSIDQSEVFGSVEKVFMLSEEELIGSSKVSVVVKIVGSFS
jgi:uncharacterized repeat protein (TIGR02543 family)